MLRRPSFQAVVGGLFLALIAAPFLLGHWRASPDWIFTGIVRLAEDNNTYMAWAKQAQRGLPFFRMVYTGEPQPAVIFLPFFLVVGFFSRASGLSLPWTMNLAQAAGIVFFLRALDRWLEDLSPSTAARRTAFALTIFCGGWGFWLQALGRKFAGFPWPAWAESGAADLSSYDLVPFNNLLHYPFSGAALGLLLWALADLRRGRPVRAGVLTGILFLVHPYDAVLAGCLAPAAVSVGRAWKSLPRFFAAAAPAALCVIGSTHANPLIAQYKNGLQDLLPSTFSCLVAWLPLLMPAGAGVWDAFRARDRRAILPVAWAAAVVLLFFVPFPLRHKWVHGGQAALCVLAARGMTVWAARGRPWVLAAGLLTASTLVGNGALWWTDVGNARQPALPFFLPRSLTEALGYLEGAARPEEVVAATRRLGLFVPSWTGAAVYAGHWDQTLRPAEKEARLARFFDPAASDEERRRFLAEGNVRWVLISPPVRDGKEGRWEKMPYLRRSFDNGFYQVYRSEA